MTSAVIVYFLIFDYTYALVLSALNFMLIAYITEYIITWLQPEKSQRRTSVKLFQVLAICWLLPFGLTMLPSVELYFTRQRNIENSVLIQLQEAETSLTKVNLTRAQVENSVHVNNNIHLLINLLYGSIIVLIPLEFFALFFEIQNQFSHQKSELKKGEKFIKDYNINAQGDENLIRFYKDSINEFHTSTQSSIKCNHMLITAGGLDIITLGVLIAIPEPFIPLLTEDGTCTLSTTGGNWAFYLFIIYIGFIFFASLCSSFQAIYFTQFKSENEREETGAPENANSTT
jgi:hypothetical protein